LEYENLPEVCSHYLKIGHHVDSCRLLKKSNDVPVAQKRNQEVRNEYNIIKDGRKKQGTNEKEPVLVKDEVPEGSKENLKDSDSNQQIHNEQIMIGEQNRGDLVLVQNNRFDALVQVEINDALQKDTKLEAEVNEALKKQAEDTIKEDSSQVSEYVDETQALSNLGPVLMSIVDGISSGPMEKDRLQELEKQNKEFLQKSWANIAENEEAEQRLLKQLEDDPNEGFQVVNDQNGELSRKRFQLKAVT